MSENPRWRLQLVGGTPNFFPVAHRIKISMAIYDFQAREIDWNNYQPPPITNYPLISVINVISGNIWSY